MNRRDLEAMFGSVPESFGERVACTLRRTKEEEIVKKKMPVALVFALVLVLACGAALAIGSGLGVLDFIQGGAPISEEAKQAIQTEFAQQGGALASVTVKVRDAVSDGRMLFLVVEAKAKNPGDAVLATADYFLGDAKQAMDTYGAWRDPESFPDWAAIGKDARVHYMMPFGDVEIVSGGKATVEKRVGVHAGFSWRYEGVDTLVCNMLIDLSRVENPKETMTINLNPTMGKLADMEKSTKEQNPLATPLFAIWTPGETAPLTVEVKAGKMEAQHAVAKTPITFGDMEITKLEVTTTPLATYMTMATRVINAENRTNWFVVHGEDDQEYEMLADTTNFAAQPLPDGSWTDVPLNWVYQSQGTAPKSIVLHAMPMNDAPADGLPEDLVVPLTEK